MCKVNYYKHPAIPPLQKTTVRLYTAIVFWRYKSTKDDSKSRFGDFERVPSIKFLVMIFTQCYSTVIKMSYKRCTAQYFFHNPKISTLNHVWCFCTIKRRLLCTTLQRSPTVEILLDIYNWLGTLFCTLLPPFSLSDITEGFFVLLLWGTYNYLERLIHGGAYFWNFKVLFWSKQQFTDFLV